MVFTYKASIIRYFGRCMITVFLLVAASATSAQTSVEFPQIRGAEPGTEATSSVVTLDGLSAATAIKIEGGTYSVNGREFTSEPSRVTNGDTLTLKVVSATEEKGLSRASVYLGDEVASFTVVTDGRSIGVNFNEQMGVLSDAVIDVNLPEIKPEWVRGFLDFYSLFDKDTLQPLPEFSESRDIARFIELKRRGYKTVLSIKWNFKAAHTPKTMPSTPEELARHQKALIALYEKVWPYVDILVVGNEPFIESPGKKVPSVDPAVVPFYSSMLEATINYRRDSDSKGIPLFLGAFNRLELPRFQEASEGLLELAKSTPEVSGIDLHIHHADSDFSSMKQTIDFATARIRPDQRFISTEFSAMHYWKSKTPLDLAPEFIKKYKLPKNMKVYEYLDQVLKEKPRSGAVTRPEWVDFVEMNSWYKGMQSRYLAGAYETFTSSPQFLLATYAFRQGFSGVFDIKRDPWILNSIFVSRTVQLRPDGSYELNRYYHHDFERLR